MSEILASTDVDPYAAMASTNLGDGSIWYRLYDDMKIFSVNVSAKQYLGSWKLGVTDPCEAEDAPENCFTPWWTGRWGPDETLEKDIIDRYALGEMGWDQGRETDDSIMGCMGRVPLRYGDIEGDGKKELAMFMLNGYSLDFLIFSPEKHKNIFTSKLGFNDVVKHETIFAEDGAMDHLLPPKELPYYQYWSRSGADTDSPFSMSQGYRSFGKLYVGHFESAQSQDILVWRKVYKSHLLADTVKGFEKISDTYVHYKLVNGEYQKQGTEQSVVRGWLEAKNLTWQKGYPSKSECPGQVGQLIPEMHDPLLNDPDVLK
ncbi:hypothetical protein FY115_12100 [Cellvibrio japonicus]|nr:hypothetical protein FY117_12100 [Cellvibrio japonicus]QEI17788.1 hypothetical protein FY116_12105 [Cellvibrio japonicus]QEI21363.1 hypothetical protein FY115_12100 [Cellvibrio japonicus]